MGEKGNSYIHYDVENDVPIVTDGIKPKISSAKRIRTLKRAVF